MRVWLPFLFLFPFACSLAQTHVVEFIELQGNKITKDHIVLRELTLGVGDTLTGPKDERILRSQENLMNTALFNSVEIKDSLINNRHGIVVKLQERWYIWPQPILEHADRNLNAFLDAKQWDRINYGVHLVWVNFRGRREQLNLKLRWGFNRELGIEYGAPFLNKKKTFGLGGFFKYNALREMPVATNLNNQRVFFESSGTGYQSYRAALSMAYRPKFWQHLSTTLMWQGIALEDSLALLFPELLGNGDQTANILTAAISLRHDRRDYHPYPWNGYMLSTGLIRQGSLDRGSLNRWVWSISADGAWAFRPRWSLRGRLGANTSAGDRAPYLFRQGLGYGLLVRGYELYVIDGEHSALGKVDLNFQLFPTWKLKLPWIKTPKFNPVPLRFHARIFADAGITRDLHTRQSNPLGNRWLTGWGGGIDLVSYYDWVFQFYIATNNRQQTGFFMHFSGPLF